MSQKCRHFLRAFSRDVRGQIAVIFALGAPALLMIAAGAIDLMKVSSARNRLQDIADAAALAGATELGLAISDEVATSRALSFVEGNLQDWKDSPTVTPTIKVIEDAGRRIVDVQLKGHTPSFFANMLPPGGWNFGATSQAVAVGLTPLCVLVTGESKTKVLNIKDTGRLRAPACMVHSNRDIVVRGGRIEASVVQAVTSASGSIYPAPGTGAAPIADPFLGLQLDEKQPCPLGKEKEKVTTGTLRLAPGVHCGGYKMGGDSVLVLAPGEHWFLGGHLELSDTARLSGTDVVLFFDKESKFDFKDHALISLDGRKSGAYAGMVIVATRGNTEDFVITSDHVENLLGVIYVPEARLIVEGTAEVARDSAWTVIVSRMLELNGAPSLVINANYSSSNVPVPEGVGPNSSGARLLN
ncbi:TadE/TadG family type IV pilus assembly protein [Brevundimonas sp. NIBR11]|uniref:TadE/TadG family type IV pilus assembly protein n=1 Tax=Brevundimonas sp. NIBR11 TaxID=3015999 RepID=UPI0022F0BD87|nr:TadE/TadG family type IV pilus assembly protein [Brevundimonas sp. NIBR11]WGM32583.1 hypothetical protein KKHFBJBL_02837 [Brevundimonas sp. NIBR11]